MNKEAGNLGAYGKSVFNTFFNPFEDKDILVPGDATPMSKSLYHAAMLGLGYGGAAYALRKILAHKDKMEGQTLTDKMESSLNARNPVLSIDPDLADSYEEEKLRRKGVIDKKELLSLDKEGAPDEEASRSKLTDHNNMFAMAAAIAGLAGGAGIGWHLADTETDQQMKEKLKERIDTTQNEIDKSLYEEYLRTRQLQDGTELPGQKVAYSESEKEVRRQSGRIQGDVATDPGAWWNLGSMAYGLYTVAATALAFKAMKNYTADNDPRRQRIKELKDVSKEMAKIKEAPTFIDATNFDKLKGVPKGAPKKNLTSLNTTAKQIETRPSNDIALQDPKDPFKDLLR